MTRLAELTARAAPWLARPVPAVDSPDRADRLALDQILADCPALARLDGELADHYGAPGLVADMWMAAYARRPELADPGELDPTRRPGRTVAAATLGSPEHAELRRSTVGDPYAAAMAVLSAAPALRRTLTALDGDDPDGRARRGARADAAAADDRVRAAYARAKADADDDPDSEVSQPTATVTQRAVAEAEAAHAALADLEQAENGPAAVGRVRAPPRSAAAAADADRAEEAQVLAAWGIGAGEWAEVDAAERMRLSAMLRGERMTRFADLIGRFRQMARAMRARRVEHARSEYVGVTLGDDLTALVPDELLGLAVPALRAQFAIRYAQRQLMVYEQRGDDHAGQGAIIALVDCSGSMEMTDEHDVTGEAYAKALMLALLDQSRAARPAREFAAILFASEPEPAVRFPANVPVDLSAQLRLASSFPGGGTDFAPALDAALDLLTAEHGATGRTAADIVLITDGEADLDDTWMARWRERKRALGFRCFGISVGWWAEPAGVLEELCDDVRRIEDLGEPAGCADLFRAI
jgi:uncharacterized protein with von Willebrand factor type A (vWA) domain